MYCRFSISATSEKEAGVISKKLVEKRLVAGTTIYKGLSHYWWKGKIEEKMYWNIEAFSLAKHKNKIIEEVRKIHRDECPVIASNKIDGNKDFLRWIKDSVY